MGSRQATPAEESRTRFCVRGTKTEPPHTEHQHTTAKAAAERAAMSRCLATSVIKRPVLRAAGSSAARGSRWSFSTGGEVGEQAPAVKMPRLTHRMRRLARAHPEAVAAVSPSAVQESRPMPAEVRFFFEIDHAQPAVICGRVWMWAEQPPRA